MGYLKATILLSDGINHCPYIDKDDNYKCKIYNERPSVCKSYPLSTNIDNIIYYDINCPGVTKLQSEGMPLIQNQVVANNFKTFIFDDYQTKYIDTHLELEKFNQKEDFELVTTINGNMFYKYNGAKKSEYIDKHLKSLSNLKNYNLSTK